MSLEMLIAEDASQYTLLQERFDSLMKESDSYQANYIWWRIVAWYKWRKVNAEAKVIIAEMCVILNKYPSYRETVALVDSFRAGKKYNG